MWQAVWAIALVFWPSSNPASAVGERPTLLARETQAQEELAKTVLRDGTAVQLRITQRLSTATAKVGDRVEFEVVQDVRVGDLVVIPHRAIAWGAISKLQSRRRPSRNALLSLEIRAAKAITGNEVPLRGTRTIKGDLTAKDIQDMVALWPTLPLMVKGSEAFVSKGGKVDAYLNGDASFDSAVLKQSMALWETKNAAVLAAATVGKAEVHIYRHLPDVVGGKPKIYLDGKELARMQGDRYFDILLDPGGHIFRTSESEVSVDCKAGEEYYLRVERQGSLFPKAHLFLVPNLQAEDEIYPLESSNPQDIVDHSKLAAHTDQ